jgi:hypothetical protein
MNGKTIEEPKERKYAHLVGQVGEFTAGTGEVYQCRVTGLDEWPYEHTLVIDYMRGDEGLIKDAMIEAPMFRPAITATEGGEGTK